jgi:4-amino-4-deoxy-L-arabinose transferase-like glycosyltransferase
MLSGVAAAGVVAAYVLLREHAVPGYLGAALFNDVSGRFGVALDRHVGPPWYYLQSAFVNGAFGAGVWALPAPLALLCARGRTRLGLLYALCVAAAVFAAVSFSATKLNQYSLPAYPFLAILSAIAAREGALALRRAYDAGRVRLLAPRYVVPVLLAAMLGTAGVRAAWARVDMLPRRQFYAQALYGELFRALQARGVRDIQVVDGGMIWPGTVAAGVPADYAPQLYAYSLIGRSQGLEVRRIAGPGSAGPGVLASCDPRRIAGLRRLGRDIGGVQGCVAVQQAPRA